METANTNGNGKRRIYTNEPNLYFILDLLMVLGIIFIILLCWYNYSFHNGSFQSALGVGLLVAGACIGIGGLTGFLFGIPKMLQNETALPGNRVNNNSSFVHNDNLVQISDWLTKIIVGVGLTQLYNIGPGLITLGDYLSKSFNVANLEQGRNIAISIVLYYSSTGFLYVYIWTRVYFLKQLREMDEEWKERAETAEKEKDMAQEQLQSAEKEKAETQQQLETSQQVTLQKQEDISALTNTFAPYLNQLKSIDTSSDPQNGKWGGKAEANGRKVSATVRESTYSNEIFIINLLVESTEAANPLTGIVHFHLHPTFPNETESVPVTDGKATLQLTAYGAFTVGVECDNGNTQLEINLCDVPDAPQLFKER